ncbi:hypothetical protein LCGC14_0898150 [marine sediment metagenome]|uniref:LITAF domain-containing protein n=1 Tax=marine sediment metagenome TaxID=412755 RepID=A0A0F9RGC0_9ZZZZ
MPEKEKPGSLVEDTQTVVCQACGGRMVTYTKGDGPVAGCLLLLLGLVLSTILIGIPLIAWGIYVMVRQHKFWRCASCGTVIPRT